MNMLRRFRGNIVLALVAITTVFILACGGDEATSTPAATTAPRPAATTMAATPTPAMTQAPTAAPRPTSAPRPTAAPRTSGNAEANSCGHRCAVHSFA